MSNNISIKTMPERHVAYVSYTGNYMANPQVFKDLFEKLGAWAGPRNLMTAETVFLSAYYDDPNVTPPEELKLDACMSVPVETEVEGEIQKKTLPGGRFAMLSVELSGPEEYGPAWIELVEWVQKNGHKVDLTRPSYEIYLNNPEEHPQKHHLVEMYLSVED